MAIPGEVISAILDRANIYDVVSRYTTLKRSGSDAKGLCPFHSERTPSFHVSEAKQVYHCFGCGAKGSVINFICDIENLSFVEAVKFLGDMYGVRVEDAYADDKTANRRKRIYEINKAAAKHFYENLVGSGGIEGRKYLISRGLSPNTINRFGLGFAKNSFNDLINYLKGLGFTSYEIADAGLSARKEGKSPYDFFRNRVMFPVFDVRGNVIAFGGRVLDDSKPKYLNSPETLIFDKRKNLFGLNIAKKSKDHRLILVEGYMDVISLHQEGIDIAVASLGTSLTEEHAQLIKRYADEVVLCYDSDEAGKKAASRAMEIFGRHSINAKVLSLNGAKDPDEFCRRYSKEKFLEAVANAKTPVLHNIGLLKTQYDISVPDEKVEFLKKAAIELAGIENPMEREVYTREVARNAQVSFESFSLMVKKNRGAISGRKKAGERAQVIKDLKQKNIIKNNSSGVIKEIQEKILNLMFYSYDACLYIEKNLGRDDFDDGVYRMFYDKVTALRSESNKDIEETDFISSFDYDKSADLAGIISIDLNFDDDIKGAMQLTDKLKAFRERQKINDLLKNGDLTKVRDEINRRKKNDG